MKRQNVKDMIRGLLKERRELASRDVQKAVGITRQAVHHHLRALVQAGEAVQIGRGRGSRYRAPAWQVLRYPLDGLEEHRVWMDVWEADERLRTMPENAVSISRFAFTEIVNNAIDHSKGTLVEVASSVTDDRIGFEVADDGIGAYRSVRQKFGLADDFTAVQQISKGKITTDPEHHTGEGIFFTSKSVDRFSLEANGLRWTVDNTIHDQAVGEAPSSRGTRVYLELDPRATRTLREVFDAYADPDTFEFSRSRAAVQLFESGRSFVSRSEAKRLANDLDRFEEVIIDFSGVSEVGQGFVDELFRVWVRDHPNTRLVPTNMSPAVEQMVRRGLDAGGDGSRQ